MLTAFHGHKFMGEISNLEGVDDNVKEGFRKLVRDFMDDLFEMAELDEEDIMSEENSAFFDTVR